VAHVIYVHGLWMPGDESVLLRRRLAQEFDLTLHPFRYSAAYSTMSSITARLESFVRELQTDEAHFVGHSLGGLVIHRFLERFPDQPPGRAVFLGTPCLASRAAEQASRFAPVAHLMGMSVA
jgi:pimeloyl-ACP methyl ester carboxylesterase